MIPERKDKNLHVVFKFACVVALTAVNFTFQKKILSGDCAFNFGF